VQDCEHHGLPWENATLMRIVADVATQIVRLSHKHPNYGYRRITALLQREGRQINAKRGARVRHARAKSCSKAPVLTASTSLCYSR
jgi:hypothetical protein